MNSDLLSGADDRPPTFTQLLRGLQEGPPSTRRLAAHAVWEGLFSLRKGHEVTEPVTPDEGLLRGELVTALTAALRAGRGTTEDEKALRYSVCRAIMNWGRWPRARFRRWKKPSWRSPTARRTQRARSAKSARPPYRR